MSSSRIQHHVSGRLSLRPPQAESLAKLVQALEAAPEMRQHPQDLPSILATLMAQFPTLEDFEKRDFPSLCFSLATGVGKTRLMGAFIAYLHLEHQINNFFVLAPNLTIYNKLISDFTPNTPKYVFKGIGEFSINVPRVITGDNYDQQNILGGELFGEVRINIFNISKINSEVRGGKEPRIKRMREVLGDSYFNHLASLDDLVLLMDESHRYRAQAGMRAINELKPLFGLEVTATPFTESSSGPIPFKNVVMDYPLARAIEDGFVKEPAVVTQRDFNVKQHTPEEVERVKLEDGVRLHEATKAELLTYARENDAKVIKPFMLVIARDTTHAGQLLALLESNVFFEGRYRGKAIQVDSSKSGKDEEEMITRLLAVESVDEPTEIVIHVNMLKEGWDVTNLYTIVPLRAANARTLIEQSIGRGLRLPFGKRTGVEAVDRLNIVAHDKFQEIIDEANRGDSPIRLKQVILDAPKADDNKTSVQVQSGAHAMLGLSEGAAQPAAEQESQPSEASSAGANAETQKPAPIFATEAEKQAARVVMEVIGQYETRRDLVPSSKDLLKKEVQEQIKAEVAERLKPQQGSLLEGQDANAPELNLDEVVAKTTEVVVQQSIDIPRITVVPTGEVTSGYHPFTLGDLPNYQPGQRELLVQELRTSKQSTLNRESGIREKRLEDYIVKKLIDFDDVDYFTQAELLYNLAEQAVAHYQKQNYAESELHEILDTHGADLARLIHAEMHKHFWEEASGYEVKVSRGFTELKPCNYTVAANQPVHSVRETVIETSRIKQMLFGGFSRCLYPLQKFDSDTERRFAVILERDALKWFKPAKGQFQIFYKLGSEQPEYVPDFVVETDSCIFLAETKAASDLETQEVQAKAAAAAQWAKHAADYALGVDGKPWKYLLIPHSEVTEAKRLMDYLRFEVKAPVSVAG
ncbi:TPA: DEAD/DEAH box helicase family protein [Pseudomonas aeruginosa]|uniref:DEAD/DEAH box helicase family protein n=1 Tax=Pseudomonas TaxID=286 RepID=UPI00070FD513|nr:DEAD/DEAH box helicase family protein [Pseudomonas aeruginosa]EKY0768465.1 DEAD/DEAH box helicase family protein [Pseudomonas aeruginosa]EMC3963035.1 DEAD/DEAH box helicase family protein [Pseudomonas aeruginosa]KRV01620.1 type III restriction endonuclease subunit R [Pseudomonas aeruginosa]MBH4505910.1 DEAD/DEAH box helicase family protein [Pseudomonas aeruginosa]MBH9388261.1 DEAD/DEAH box helicase family protein [Pseudomonas aeruginosa]